MDTIALPANIFRAYAARVYCLLKMTSLLTLLAYSSLYHTNLLANLFMCAVNDCFVRPKVFVSDFDLSSRLHYDLETTVFSGLTVLWFSVVYSRYRTSYKILLTIFLQVVIITCFAK